MQTVYVDILILTNFLVDYFILKLSAYITKIEVKTVRLIITALIAAFSSLLIFAPEMSAPIEVITKLTISVLIILIAFGKRKIKSLLKSLLVFYAANALIVGGAMVIWTFFKPNGLVIRNATVFVSISPVTLVLTTALVYAITLLVSGIYKKKTNTGSEKSMTLVFMKKRVKVNGIVDSGNMLKDMISGAPVIVCDYQSVKSLFDDEQKIIFESENYFEGYYEKISSSSIANRIRIIPFNSVSDSGLMTAVVLDKAILHLKDKDKEIDNVVMAVTHKSLSGGEFDVLINPEIVTV